MTARLILNADDFGLTSGVNRAIGELNSAGVLTSTTLMANGPAFEDAVTVARAHQNLGVGCHIVLTDGTPVSSPETIPTLLGPDRKTFRPTLSEFVRALLLGRIRAADIAREALAQIEKLQRAGIPVTHLDSHKHTHLFPSIARTLLDVAERTSIRTIRNPFEPDWSLGLNHGSRVRRLSVHLTSAFRPRFAALPQLAKRQVRTTDGTIAVSATGELNVNTLADILHALPSTGTYELCCHPGYNDSDLDRVATRLRTHRDVEREALLSEIPKILAQQKAPRLVHYGSLGASG